MLDPSSPRLRSVLVVDDDDDDRFIASRALKKCGQVQHTLSARDGREALDMFVDRVNTRAKHPGAFPPTLTILDINMPRMNGIEFLEALQALDLPDEESTDAIVLLSSSDSPQDRAVVERFERVRGYLVKPLTVKKAKALADQFGHSAGA